MQAPGKRRKGGPKQRWMDRIKHDFYKERIIGRRRGTRQGCLQAINPKHRYHKVGKYAADDDDDNVCKF